MDLKEHYASYKKSFASTMIKGYDKFLKETPYPEVFPTAWERAKNLVSSIEARLEGGDMVGYLENLRKHQAFMLESFRTLALKHITYGGISEAPTTAVDWRRAIDAFGWVIFRYSGCPGMLIKFEEADPCSIIYLTPLFDEHRRPKWSNRVPCFDAEEMIWLDKADSPEKVRGIVTLKSSQPSTKLLPDLSHLELVEKYNSLVVRDWALSI